jgi:enoyl-CoA hydratase/carnithine racemase
MTRLNQQRRFWTIAACLAKDPAQKDRLATALNAMLEAVRLSALLLTPIMPGKCARIRELTAHGTRPLPRGSEDAALAELEGKVVEMAERIAQMPSDLVQLNKRLVHRQMEMMGMRTALRVGTELCALGTHQKSMHEFIARVRSGGLTTALQERDAPFGDYRTTEPKA